MLLVSLLALASIQEVETPAPPSMLTVTVKKLPKDFKEDPVVSVTFNASGAVASCKLAKASGNASIDRVACSQILANGMVTPEAGKIPEPRDTTVTFVQEAPQG
ncbi:MAG: hypothetical protein EOP60_03945 [Sphingomonadales bacterium]|nr:MAG: hypothetical protein EOP60_03945 [Sphingomonadales bacterium]